MQAEIERIANLIRPHLEKDPTKFYDMEQFEKAISEGSSAQNAGWQASESLAPVARGRQAPLANGQGPVPPMQDRAGMGGQPPGGGMMQGASNIGLVKFVRDRIDNVTKQLRGEIPSAGNSTEPVNSNFMRGQPGNQQNRQIPPGNERMPPSNMEGQGPPSSFDRGRGNMSGSGNMPAYISSQQYYLIGGSILLLLTVLFMVIKRKNKYSV